MSSICNFLGAQNIFSVFEANKLFLWATDHKVPLPSKGKKNICKISEVKKRIDRKAHGYKGANILNDRRKYVCLSIYFKI